MERWNSEKILSSQTGFEPKTFCTLVGIALTTELLRTLVVNNGQSWVKCLQGYLIYQTCIQLLYLASAYCACLSANVLCTGLSLEDS